MVAEQGAGFDPTSQWDRGLRLVAALGAILFGAAFAFVQVAPGTLESSARSFVVERVSTSMDARLDSLATSGRLGALAQRFPERADSLRVAVREGFRVRLDGTLTRLCHYECEAGVSPEGDEAAAEGPGFAPFARAYSAVVTLAQRRYSDSVTALVRELRIFTATNSVLFLLILGASLVRPGAPTAAKVALWLMLVVTGLSIGSYVLFQDWVYLFLSGDYLGFGYALWILIVLVLVLDWVFAAGAMTSAIAETIGAVVEAITG